MRTDSQPQRRRIAVITTSYPRFPGDSAGHFVAAEVHALLESGHRVTVYVAGRPRAAQEVGTGTASDPAPSMVFLGGEELFDHPGALQRFREKPSRAIGLLPATLKLCLHRKQKDNSRGFDQIIAHWLFPSALPWARFLAKSETPLEVVIHGSDLQLLLKMPRPLRNGLLRKLLKRRARIRFVSARMKQELLSTQLPPLLRAYLSDARVEAARMDLSVKVSRTAARARLSLSESTVVGVVVGRLIDQKRQRTALAAAELIPNMTIFVVGDGPLRAELEHDFPEAIFLGQLPREQALLWIAAADLCLSTSRLEGAPTTVREARALGTPVVAVDSGDCKLWSKNDPELWIVD